MMMMVTMTMSAKKDHDDYYDGPDEDENDDNGLDDNDVQTIQVKQYTAGLQKCP